MARRQLFKQLALPFDAAELRQPVWQEFWAILKRVLGDEVKAFYD